MLEKKMELQEMLDEINKNEDSYLLIQCPRMQELPYKM